MQIPIVTLLLAVSVLLMVLGVPMMLRRIPPNPYYGLRVPATFADRWVWYEANARSGRDVTLLGVILTALATAMPWFPFPPEFGALAWAAVAAIGATVMGVAGWRRAERLLTERRRQLSGG
jgi:uncharacterized membrane protein